MERIDTLHELRAWAEAERRAGRRTALVPTMGALHAGHLSLVAEARRRADTVLVSIFVNPTQFAPGEDLASYPRDLDGDLAACRAAGVDAVFTPTPDELYPEGAQTWVQVSELAEPLCGRSRPTFFRGVATVVAKLLAAARPQVAVFGAKDYQQLLVIRRMARDLCFDTEIAGCPIVREPDGLALSSRNAHLEPAQRREALALVRALDAAEAAVRAGELDRDALLGLVRREIAKSPSAEIDYAELRDATDLDGAPPRLDRPVLLALAVRFPIPSRGPDARVRLIDNRVLPVQRPDEETR